MVERAAGAVGIGAVGSGGAAERPADGGAMGAGATEAAGTGPGPRSTAAPEGTGLGSEPAPGGATGGRAAGAFRPHGSARRDPRPIAASPGGRATGGRATGGRATGGRATGGLAPGGCAAAAGPGGARADAFLGRAGWSGAARAALAGDASGRRYERLTRAGAGDPRTAVLMLAPPEAAPSLRAFLDVASRLSGLGLSAPCVIAAAPAAGLMLMEDLGDALLARTAAARPAREPALYAAAADALVALRAAGPPSGLPPYDAEAMAEATALAAPWYARAERAPWVGPLREALARHAGPAETLILRDYHAENLIWLPGRRGAARVGLLDFQDAMRGPAAYDLASLTRDARRDVSPAAAAAAIARFARGAGADPARLDAALAVLGAQRNLRLLGVFARLARRDGLPRYLALLPRVWGQLAADLDHPACADVRGPALDALPPPGSAPIAAGPGPAGAPPEASGAASGTASGAGPSRRP